MPNYYNPYNFYPVQYANQMGYNALPIQQSQPASQPQLKAMEWVEGEVGAKAFQMPQGWPANQPIVLWDSTDTVIWLKSWGPMGIPNPMQKLKYVMPDQQSQSYLLNTANDSSENQNTSGESHPDLSRFATKDDIASLREEVRQMSQRSMPRNIGQDRSGNYNNSGNQNGSGNVPGSGNQGIANRGGNQ